LLKRPKTKGPLNKLAELHCLHGTQLSEQRGATPAISLQTMEVHVIPEVQALQQGKKSQGQKGKAQGAPNRFVLQAILQRSYRAALLKKGRTSLGRLLGPSALRTAMGRFRKLKGVVFNFADSPSPSPCLVQKALTSLAPPAPSSLP